ncbi:hypothetical protein ACHAWF_010050 [Thalassiosira exigua]
MSRYSPLNMKKWRHIAPYAAILCQHGQARLSSFKTFSVHPQSTTGDMQVDTGKSDQTDPPPLGYPLDKPMKAEQPEESMGGGEINEKQRLYGRNTMENDPDHGAGDKHSWNPSGNLSHLLHAMVGLDRYPNYLSRFQDSSDLDSLEHALESKLLDVRQQRSAIDDRRNGIQQLVQRYASSNFGIGSQTCTGDSVGDIGCDDCSKLWRNHPSLSCPKTWAELRQRRILQEQAFKVIHQSISKDQKKHVAKSRKTTSVEALSTVEDIIEGNASVSLCPSLLEDWMCIEMFDVYSFPLLTEEFCGLIRKTLRDLSSLAETAEFSHLQLGRRPIDLNVIGLGWLTDLLFHGFIQPISSHLFATTEKLVDCEHYSSDGNICESKYSTILDWRQGYVAGYSAGPKERRGTTRHRLVPHTDDSEVTLNCCLGGDFEGGSVEFFGLRGTPQEGQLVGKVQRPNVGTALLHSGRHLHAVSDVLSGDRYAYIIWTRSWSRLRSVACPCCWLNRRQDSVCICDKRWN